MMIALLLACSHQPPAAVSATPATERLRVQLSADYTTAGRQVLSAASAALLAPVGLDLDVVLSRQEARRFRDGSVGWLVRFESASGTVRRGEETAAAPLTLAGRSIELRTFPDGELLDVSLAEYIVGPGRHGDALDVIFPAITPAPPLLKDHQTAPRAMSWPVRISTESVALFTLRAQWTQLESAPRHLSYTGPLSMRGTHAIADRRMPISARGEGSGEVWLRSDGALLRHVFSWSREVSLGYPGPGEFDPIDPEPIRLRQSQRFVGTVERLP